MKYYSYIDQLNLSLEDLIDFSPYALKNVSDKLSQLSNTEKISILTGLEDSVSRSYHICIESNSWLKALLLEDYEKLKTSKIEFNPTHVDYIHGFKLFLESYIRPIITDVIDYFINKNELKVLLYILSVKELYSDNCVVDIKHILKNKISEAITYLSQPITPDPNEEIRYIKNYHFYKILNIYKPHFDNEALKIYDKISVIISDLDINTESELLKFCLQVQVAFKEKEVDDVATKLVIDSTADTVINDAYKPVTNTTIDVPKTSHLKYYALASVIVILIVIPLLYLVLGTFNKKDSRDVSNEIKISNKRKNKYDNRIQFYYSLKLLAQKKATSNGIYAIDEITPFSNPYPKTFNPVAYYNAASHNANTHIINKTNADLIVFKMIKGKDQSIYIPKNKDIYIALNPSDSLLFTSGENFIESKLSHFSQDMSISDIYRIDTIDNISPSEIIIDFGLNKISTNDQKIPRKAIQITENIIVNKMNIDDLYRAYYYRNKRY